MNTQTAIVILVVLILAVIGALLYLAMAGNVVASSILFALWSVFCIVIGWLLSYLQNRTQDTREQESFVNNAKENLALMSAMQSVQNKQNQTLMQQLGRAARLPDPDNGSTLLISDHIFDELEDWKVGVGGKVEKTEKRKK